MAGLTIDKSTELASSSAKLPRVDRLNPILNRSSDGDGGRRGSVAFVKNQFNMTKGEKVRRTVLHQDGPSHPGLWY